MNLSLLLVIFFFFLLNLGNHEERLRIFEDGFRKEGLRKFFCQDLRFRTKEVHVGQKNLSFEPSRWKKRKKCIHAKKEGNITNHNPTIKKLLLTTLPINTYNPYPWIDIILQPYPWTNIIFTTPNLLTTPQWRHNFSFTTPMTSRIK